MFGVSLVVMLGLSTPIASIDPDQFPFALHRNMEIDDLERAIRHQRDEVAQLQARLKTSRKLMGQGALSNAELRRDQFVLDLEQAREQELRAFQTLKIHERDVLGQKIPHDEVKSYELILNLLRKQEAMGRVDLEYRRYLADQTSALAKVGAQSRQDRDLAETDYRSALANVAISIARQRQVELELGVRRGQITPNSEEFRRRKSVALRALIEYHLVARESARLRLRLSESRVERGLTMEGELEEHRRALTDLDESIASDREKLRQLDEESANSTKPIDRPGSSE